MRMLSVALLALTLTSGLTAQRIKLPASLSDLEQRARADSNDAAAHYNVALAYWNEKRWEDADSALHRAIRLDPRFAAAYMALSGLPFARRSQLADEIDEDRVPAEWKPALEQSDRMYRQAVMIDPLVELRIGDTFRPRAQQYLDLIQELFGEWARDYSDGLDMYYQGKYQDAYERFQRVFFEVGGDRHVDRLSNSLLYWHALAAAQVQRHDEAIWDIGTVLHRYLDVEESKKDSTLRIPLRTNEFRYVLGFLKQRGGHENEAIDLYREAIQNDIGLYMAHVRLADMYEAHAMWEPAIAERHAAVNANPDDPSLLLDLGKTLALAGSWVEAEHTLQDAVTANSRDPRPHYYLGIVAQHQNEAANARQALKDFIALAPSRYAHQVADAKQRLASIH